MDSRNTKTGMESAQQPWDRPLTYVVVGSGFRSLYFARIAARYPNLFHMPYLLCRTQEKADRIAGEHGIPTTVSLEACLQAKPDFVVIAVNRQSTYPVAREWLERGFPVMLETPAGASEEELCALWELSRYGARIQVAEQYHRYPVMAAGLRAIQQGKLDDPYAVYLSLAHDYHGASLIRRMLNIGLEPVRIRGDRCTTTVVRTDSRYGPITDGSTADQIRTRMEMEFQSGKRASYDFTDIQYRTFIRSRHVNVQGKTGEWNDCFLRYVTEEDWLPKQEMLLPYLDPRYQALATKEVIDSCTGWTPALVLPHVQDEYAVATMLYDMKQYLEGGKEVYPLAEALEDAYIWLLFEEAAAHPGEEVRSRKMPWHVCP